MPGSQDDQLRQKVDVFLRDALKEPDPAVRAKLLGKAVYWNQMVAKADSAGGNLRLGQRLVASDPYSRFSLPV